MNNFEFFNKEINHLLSCGKMVSVKRDFFNNYEIMSCDINKCNECIFYSTKSHCYKNFLEWCFEYKMDLSNVPIDKPCLVSNYKDGPYYRGHFAGQNIDGFPSIYGGGRTSWTAANGDKVSYQYIKFCDK